MVHVNILAEYLAHRNLKLNVTNKDNKNQRRDYMLILFTYSDVSLEQNIWKKKTAVIGRARAIDISKMQFEYILKSLILKGEPFNVSLKSQSIYVLKLDSVSQFFLACNTAKI